MPIKIASWNIEGRLSGNVKRGRGSTGHILENIEALNADILVLLESFMDAPADGVLEKFQEHGYLVCSSPYEDNDRQKNKYLYGAMHMTILSRLPINGVEYIRPGDVRNLIACEVTEPESGKTLRIIATHLDDRSEALRIRQVEDLAGYVNQTATPTIMLGDFNAMWHEGRALFLDSRFVRFFGKCIPHKALRGVVLRAADMASGPALSLLAEKTRLREVDFRHRPTATPKRYGTLWMPSIRLIQIDHMLVSPEVTATNFEVGRDGGSDHRPISATVSLK